MISIIAFTEMLLFVLAYYMSITRSMAICVVISNVISATMVFIYCILQAPDIAITEAVIGTAASTVLFALVLLYIKKLPTNKDQNVRFVIDIRQRLFVFLLCLILFLLIVFIIQNIPTRSIEYVSTSKRLSVLYVMRAIKDFGFSSIVTAVVAGYRAFDTMFENVVIFTACYGFYDLLMMDKKNKVSKI